MPATLPQRVLRALADARTAEEAIDAMLAQVTSGLGATVAMLWLLDADDRMLVWAGDHSTDPAAAELRDVSRRLTFGRGDGLPGRTVESDGPLVIDDVAADPGFARLRAANAAGVASAIAAPLAGAGRSLGVVEAFWARGAEVTPAHIEGLDGAARQLAAYLGRVRVEQRLRASEERNAAIVSAALDCVVTMDHEGRVLDFNPAAEATFGHPREEAVGQVLAELIIPPELRDAHHRALARYLETGNPTILDRRLELSAVRRDGSEFPVELTVTRLGAAEPPLFAGFIRDISDRRHAEAERDRLLSEAISSRALAEASQQRSAVAKAHAEAAGRRLSLLARASAEMLAARDDDEIMHRLVALIVPELAGWCGVTVETPGLPPRIVASETPRPPDGELLAIPLRGTRGAFGTIAFGGLSPDDASIAENLAARAALAIENARLFVERSHIAETLQRSLLPLSLPEIPGLEVAARYRAAGEANLVGGDFYDLFPSADGVWTAILGDVSGKGPEAAAVTALTRHTLRAGALREPSPKANLLLLNEALMASRDREWRFATVVFARVCREDDGATVTVSTGGHPPPVIRRADGSVEEVDIRGTLLGSVASPVVEDRDVHLGPGDLLLLYTDGVTEVRTREPTYGDRLLRRVLAEHGAGTAEALVAAIERAAVEAQEGEPRDDIAMLALRVPG